MCIYNQPMHSDPPALATKNSIVIIPDIRYNDSLDAAQPNRSNGECSSRDLLARCHTNHQDRLEADASLDLAREASC
jgi:hypothetical protein